jgi:hypothetical protein
LVEIEECAVQAGLVEVAAGHLDPSGVGDPARFQRVEAGGIETVAAGGISESELADWTLPGIFS